MQGRRWPVTWVTGLLVVASLVVAAPLAMAAVESVGKLFVRSPEPGYLLYPRLGLCTPSRSNTSEAAAPGERRLPRAFRPTRTADAAMPPELGQSLSSRSLEPGQISSAR
jgi:hypothetical protein